MRQRLPSASWTMAAVKSRASSAAAATPVGESPGTAAVAMAASSIEFHRTSTSLWGVIHRTGDFCAGVPL